MLQYGRSERKSLKLLQIALLGPYPIRAKTRSAEAMPKIKFNFFSGDNKRRS